MSERKDESNYNREIFACALLRLFYKSLADPIMSRWLFKTYPKELGNLEYNLVRKYSSNEERKRYVKNGYAFDKEEKEKFYKTKESEAMIESYEKQVQEAVEREFVEELAHDDTYTVEWLEKNCPRELAKYRKALKSMMEVAIENWK